MEEMAKYCWVNPLLAFLWYCTGTKSDAGTLVWIVSEMSKAFATPQRVDANSALGRGLTEHVSLWKVPDPG